jgi:hypothetical protein
MTFDREPGKVVLYLSYDGEGEIDATFCFTLRNSSGDVGYVDDYNTEHKFEEDGEGYGQPQLIERSTLLEEANKFLINGALHIEVTIQVKPLKAILHQLLNPLSKNMLNLLCSGDDADVVFDVMGGNFELIRLFYG